MEETLGPFHVPQQSRRYKLRINPQNDAVEFPLISSYSQPLQQPTPAVNGGLNLSLSTHAYNATPVGPFTGYATILGRSRFLGPAEELLEDFCRGNGTSFEKEASKLLENSGSWFGDDEADISSRCNNPTLLSMLHEVYKRYKLYCQQMHSAVTSFESVAGLGNAAPFICFAIKAMFRHFHCLKNAILDHIRVTGKVFSSVDIIRKGCNSASCSADKDKGQYEQKQQFQDPNFLQHPVWRSQRGFPDKAVAVLRTWLFEHFLHPYPSDSDKQMLAQKTGLSRSQVSNWFTNARVRLWKPMVEEMHALERKTHYSKAANASTDYHFSVVHPHLSQKDLQMYMDKDHESHCKRTRIEELPRSMDLQSCQQPSNQATIDIGGNQETATGISWSAPVQIVPFWLAKQ